MHHTYSKPPANRKGAFIGLYVPQEIKDALIAEAATDFRTLSGLLGHVLDHYHQRLMVDVCDIDERCSECGEPVRKHLVETLLECRRERDKRVRARKELKSGQTLQ